MAVTQDFAETLEDGRRVLRFSGNLTMLRVRKLNQQLKALPADNLTVDLTEVERMDTVGAWLVHKLERDHGAKLVGATEEQQLLIEHVTKSDRPVKVRREYEPPLRLLLAETGMATQIAIRTMVGLLGFFGALIISVSNIVRHPRRFRFNAVVAQCMNVRTSTSHDSGTGFRSGRCRVMPALSDHAHPVTVQLRAALRR